jgi:signal transduction histidine kinase
LQNSTATKVFVVDDDRGLLRLIQKVLEREGLDSVCAASGKEALAWLSRERAELMLLDLKLHDIEGKDLVNRLTETRRSVPFIVITGQGDARVAVDMMKRGALDYVIKDADFLQFLPEVVRRAFGQLEKDKRLIQLQKQVLEISEREQRRIGQDLHDGLGQQLTAIEMMFQSLKNNAAVAADPGKLKKELDNLSQYIRSAITQTRSLAHGLTPFKVTSGGLEIALAELAKTTTATGRIVCKLQCKSPVTLDDPEAATNLYRIAQEAVNNAVKHSGGSRISIELYRKKGTLSLRISDNGKGLSTPDTEGLGLRVMNHRAGVVGAQLQINSTKGKGVVVSCLLPEHH